KVTERRTAVDYAHVLKDVSDTHFKDAEKIVLVQDNLNTHSPASLYEAFPPAEARRLVERFEWHYTPKHGSWLDLAGIRTRYPLRSVSRPPHPRQTDPHRGNRRLGTRPKCQSHKGRLAIHNPIRSSQTQVPIPFD